ncbi:MAG: hypothetical protein ACPG1C_15105 [Alphaproteobacteria bacterium]
MMGQNLRPIGALLLAIPALVVSFAHATMAAKTQPSESYFYSSIIQGDWPEKLGERFLLFDINLSHPNATHTLRVWYDAQHSFTDCVPQLRQLEYFCLLSGYYAFIYPRGRSANIKNWSYRSKFGDGNYRIVEEGVSVNLDGKRFDGLLRIETSASATLIGQKINRSYETLYSPKAGIVAILPKDGLTGEAISRPYWLDGQVGIGAIED